jgi:hypothetical protein
MLDMVRRDADPDSVIAKMANSDAARVLAIACRCAGRTLLGEHESVARTVRDYPNTLPALLRPAGAALHPDIADMLADLTEGFISALAAKSPAAEVLMGTNAISLANWSGGALRVDEYVLWPGEIAVSVVVPRDLIDGPDRDDVIGKALCVKTQHASLTTRFFAALAT